MLVENNLYEYFTLVTDDVMADHLLEGHLNNYSKCANIVLQLNKNLLSRVRVETALYDPIPTCQVQGGPARSISGNSN